VTPAQLVSLGRPILAAYADSFLADPSTLDLSGLPETWKVLGILSGVDRDLVRNVPTVYGFVAARVSDSTIHVFINGTKTAIEWLEDAEFIPWQVPFLPAGCLAHKGFLDVYASLTVNGESLRDFLGNFKLYSPFFHGHSLGAALATLGAVELGAWTPPELGAHTLWASPRVFSAYAAYVVGGKTKPLLRLVNPRDAVPDLPPAILGFTHVGTEQGVAVTAVPKDPADPLNVKRNAHVLANYLNALDPSIPVDEDSLPAT